MIEAKVLLLLESNGAILRFEQHLDAVPCCAMSRE